MNLDLPPSRPPGTAWEDRLLRGALRPVSPGGRRGRLSIVIFHRVMLAPDPLFPEDPDRERFAQICAWLARWFNVLPLRDAVALRERGALPERALCITFDDGYADNHDLAMPVLRSLGLSATFFIATGYLDGGRMWNDTIVEAVRRCRQPVLELASMGLPGIDRLDLGTDEARRRSLHALLSATKYLPQAQRLELADRIAERAQVDLPGDLMMTAAQVRAMAANGMHIGAHTITHPILARVDEAQARREMATSKADLESLLGEPVTLFAYPNGRPGRDYTARDAELVARLGFRAAVSTAAGAARPGDGLDFQLPRFTPWDRGRFAFGTRMLRNYFERVDRV